MKSALYGIAVLLIFGMAVCTDGVEAQYGMVLWSIGAAVSLAVAWLMIRIADQMPDKPQRRR